MKTCRQLSLLITLFAFLFTSCGEGPAGPQGPPGPEILPQSFEFNATMVLENDFEDFHDIPADIDVFDSDVMMVFVLEGDDPIVWRQLPLTEFNSRGTVVINFDFTVVDLRVFMEANYPLGQNDGFSGVLMRAVHVPADFAGQLKAKGAENIQTYKELESLLGVEIQVIGNE